MSTPKFKGPDGVYREEYIFTTSLPRRSFEGQMDADTVDMQVSVRGSAFTSDPDLIYFEGTTFVIPNPSAYPDGLPLLAGDNTIEVKSILTNGTATGTGSIRARLATEADIGNLLEAPSGIWVEQFDSTVKVTIEGIDDPDLLGYHFYASTQPGGGTSGYYRINPSLVEDGETSERLTTLAELAVDAQVKKNTDGTAAADPLFLAVSGVQQDLAGVALQTDFDESMEIPETVGRVRTTVAVESVREVDNFSFTHDRDSTYTSSVNPAIPNSGFNTIPTSDPLYYVVTAVYSVQGVEYESAFSPEVAGAPLVVTPALGSLPQVSRQQILRDTTLSIYRSQPEVDVKPGSVPRDTFVDPFATEAERMRFLVGFFHNAQSFATLLLIDDPGLTGTSVPVTQSAYKLALKQALFLKSTADVQTLIDSMFEHLASKVGVTRDGGKRSRGAVTFYTTSRPETTKTFSIGTAVGGGRFRTTSFAQITPTGSSSIYDPSTGRYAVEAYLQATSPGEAYNLAEGQIKTLDVAQSGVSVTNTSRTFGGTNRESNRNLAARASQKVAGLDSGRMQGYVNTSIEVPGVRQVNVVDGGHPLMMRDMVDGTHTGGKVDIWVRGESEATHTDTFAFSFEIAHNIQFEPTGDLSDLKFRAVDPNLSDSNPIIEMLNYPGFEFVNSTTGETLNLTDVTIIPPDGIQLSSSYNDPDDNHLEDVFFGSYRYRTSERHVFTRQPVRSITSLVGTVTGTVSPTLYQLYHVDSPLVLGRSTKATDHLRVVDPAAGNPASLPSGDPVQVTGESHVMLGGTEYLNNLGINPISVKVYSDNRDTEYVGPYDPSIQTGTSPDFTLVDEEGTTPLGIVLTNGSRIGEGDTVLVDYQHDENFTVTYKVNSVVSVLQSDVDGDRHITADVIGKEGVQVGVSLYATVVMNSTLPVGTTVSTIDSGIRTALAQLFQSLTMAQPLRQSDVIRVIEQVTGVSYVVVPLTKLVKEDESMVVREALTSDQDVDVFHVTAWSTDLLDMYLLVNPLAAATSDGGGPEYEFRGVFQDDIRMDHLNTSPNAIGVPLRNMPEAAFIIGNQGLVIPGYSDDATLQAQFPFATAAELDTYKKTVSANRVLVTVAKGESPTSYDYTVTYFVYGDEGVKNIETGTVEFLSLGLDLDLTYDTDRDYQARLLGRGV